MHHRYIAIILVLITFYVAYRLYYWLPQAVSSTRDCPNCDGKGYWYSARDREDCKVCNRTGRVPK